MDQDRFPKNAPVSMRRKPSPSCRAGNCGRSAAGPVVGARLTWRAASARYRREKCVLEFADRAAFMACRVAQQDERLLCRVVGPGGELGDQMFAWVRTWRPTGPGETGRLGVASGGDAICYQVSEEVDAAVAASVCRACGRSVRAAFVNFGVELKRKVLADGRFVPLPGMNCLVTGWQASVGLHPGAVFPVVKCPSAECNNRSGLREGFHRIAPVGERSVLLTAGTNTFLAIASR